MPALNTPTSAPARAFSVAGAALFAGALGFFLYSYFYAFARATSGTGSTAAAVAWNVGLFAVFGLHHSVCARDAAKAWVTRVAPGQERSVYVWVASLLLILVCAGWRPVAGTAWELQGPWVWLLHALKLSGVVITVRSASLIDVFELAGVRGSTGPADEHGDGFTSAGPYGWVRHPIYAGWFLVVFPVAAMTMTQLVFALASALYLLVGLEFEERSLRRAAPEAYTRYRALVRWKLLPGVY